MEKKKLIQHREASLARFLYSCLLRQLKQCIGSAQDGVISFVHVETLRKKKEGALMRRQACELFIGRGFHLPVVWRRSLTDCESGPIWIKGRK